MKLVERSFRLEAEHGLGRTPRPELIGPVLTHVHRTLDDAVRMGFIHSTRIGGRLPKSLKAAGDVHYTGHSSESDGSTLLHFRVSPFGGVAGELFKQKLLWEDGPQPEETAFELLSTSLHDIGVRRKESNRFDAGLLHRISVYGKLLNPKRGLTQITLPDAEVKSPGRFDRALIESAKELEAATPPERRVQITGKLDLMGVSQRVLKIQIDATTMVTAVWNAERLVEDFAPWFGKDVTLQGLAVFRPSGSLLRIDADAIAPAAMQDEFFRKLPVATSAFNYTKATQLRPGGKSAYAALGGILGTDESDAEFLSAIAELD